jgi:hypothetical protein
MTLSLFLPLFSPSLAVSFSRSLRSNALLTTDEHAEGGWSQGSAHRAGSIVSWPGRRHSGSRERRSSPIPRQRAGSNTGQDTN